MNPLAVVNQHSYAIAAVILIALAAREVWRRGPTPRALALFAALAAGLVAPPIYLRAGSSGAADLDAALASGRPTLVEIYSDL
ncbi:MAG TPA: hypothetical protein VMJ92_02215 [Candidatus Limnocylindrales bacterium]|nr:hypothetical protein [Candidatus Limnocylindrales bacterium]